MSEEIVDGVYYHKIRSIFNQFLGQSYDSKFLALRNLDLTWAKPKKEVNLFTVVPSDSTEDTVLQVVSGSGSDSLTTVHVASGDFVMIESMGLEVEFSSTPNITWNAGKYIRIQRKHLIKDGSEVSYEIKFGGLSDSVDNWRLITSLSESMHYMTNNKPTGKDHARYDLVAAGNHHYWFINENENEYIKLVADAGIFTWSSDKPIIFMKGYVFDYDEIFSR